MPRQPATEPKPSRTVTIAHPNHNKPHTVSREAFEKVWSDKGYTEVSETEDTATPTGTGTTRTGDNDTKGS